MSSFLENKIVQSGIAGVPYIGGAIQAYIANVISERNEKQWNELWRTINEEIDRIDKEKIDNDFLNSEEFALLVRDSYRQASDVSDDEHLQYLSKFFTASILKVRPDKTWRNFFMKFLREMSGLHIAILKHYGNKQRGLSYSERFLVGQADSGVTPISIKDLSDVFSKTDKWVIELVLSDCESMGLVARWTGHDKEISSRSWSLTDSGCLFFDFLTYQWGSASNKALQRTR